MKIPLHSLLRKKFRVGLYFLLHKLFKKFPTKNSIEPDELHNILIIRPNYRIGNIIFLTPLINEIAKTLPNVRVDVVVGMKLAGNILAPMPNIDNIINIPRKLLLHPFKLYKLIKKVRSKKYDLALNISDGSMSSELVTVLVNAKYKASFKNEKTFIHLTHTVKAQNLYTHSGSRPLELLKLFTSDISKQNVELDIKLTKEERILACKELDYLLKKNNMQRNSKIIALFRNARYDKKISDTWWNEWHQELLKIDSSIILIDVLSPDIISKLNHQCLEYSSKNLRNLGAFFSCCDLYVSADTGPLHLSCASQAKTLALFNKTDIKTYGTLGENNLTLDINNLSLKDVAGITYKQLTSGLRR